MTLLDELYFLARELELWFDIDKVKSYSVYVWTKDVEEPTYTPGENVFDIYADHLQFYTCLSPWELPNEAMPVIKKIQEKLAEIEKANREPTDA